MIKKDTELWLCQLQIHELHIPSQDSAHNLKHNPNIFPKNETLLNFHKKLGMKDAWSWLLRKKCSIWTGVPSHPLALQRHNCKFYRSCLWERWVNIKIWCQILRHLKKNAINSKKKTSINKSITWSSNTYRTA